MESIIFNLSHYYGLLTQQKTFWIQNRKKIDKDPLTAEQNNYLSKIVNAYIVHDLDAWPRKLTNNFKFKNCLFVGTSLVKNSNKEKYVDSG